MMDSGQTKPPVSSHADTADSRISGVPLDAFTRSILRMGLAGLFAGGSAMALLVLTLHAEQGPRLLGPLSFVFVAIVSWILLRRGKDNVSLLFATYGTWVVATGIMFTSGGVMANTVILFPLIILLAGWMLGLGSAITLAILSSIAVLAIATLDDMNVVVHRWPSSPYLYWLADTAAFALSVGVIAFLHRAHQQHVADVRTLTAALERERADAAAAESLRRHKDLLDHTGRLARVGGWEFDVTRKNLVWTDETFRLHDLEPGDTPGVDHAVDFYAPEARQAIRDAVNRAIEKGVGYDLELPLDTAKGKRIWIRTIGEPQFEGGRVVRLSGALQDITEHRQADQELMDSLNNLRRTLEATGDGIFAYDGNDPSGRLLFANDRFFEIWNIPLEQAATTGRTEIIAAARRLFPDPDAGVRRIQEILALREIHEDKVTLNDGRVLSRRSIPLSEGSQISRVWSFRDITAEERAKAELIASRDEAQRANAAKSEFLSRMSHELRTPMHAIMGMMSLARRRMHDPKGLEYLGKARAAADHLLSVINDILDISKIEAGRLELEQVDFQLADVLRNLNELIGSKAAEKGLTLSIEFDSSLGDRTLRGDPLRIGQILLNLVGNAIKFSDRGSIVVRATLIEDNKEGSQVRFEVSDQGIGVAPEIQERLFLAFEQADGSMTRKFGGTGLGLAISKRLVQLMDGAIGVESVPEAGSCFWFSIRLAPPLTKARTGRSNPSADAVAQELARCFAGARILLAEDDPVGREVALTILGDAGLTVDAAADGAEALQLARDRTYDLILMDMRMPNMNGVEAASAIRADSLNRDTAILALTANAFEEDRRACLDAGMNDHIGKPVAPGVLLAKLLHWLGQPRNAA